MNKIFKTKHNASKNTCQAVSELASQYSSGKANKSKLNSISLLNPLSRALKFVSLTGVAFSLSLALSLPASGFTVRDYYTYQTFLDIAQNKGPFKPGRSGFLIPLKDGQSGFMNYPMVDFAVANFTHTPLSGRYYGNPGAGSLINSGYIGGTSHATPLISEYRFGNNIYSPAYSFFDIFTVPQVFNGKPGFTTEPDDISILRLSKLVVDVAPIPLLPEEIANNPLLLQDKKRFPLFARVGGGIHFLNRDSDNSKNILSPRGYEYILGGFSKNILINKDEKKPELGWLITPFDVEDRSSLPFADGIDEGDSASPMFVYDSLTNQWYTIGAVSGPVIVLPPSRLEQYIRRDTDPDVNLNGRTATWNAKSLDGDNGTSWQWHGVRVINNGRIVKPTYNDRFRDADLLAVRASKHLRFFGGGIINLAQRVDLGAGALYFDENQHYTFNGEKFSWAGAGLDIGANTIVDWNVPGVAGDDLHKIGKGTLRANIASPGGIKVGDGTLELNSDSRAFDKIFLTSGRGKVKINKLAAFDPTRFYFDFRGGELDLNGFDMTFNHVNAEDEGAVINNSNKTTPSQLTFQPTAKNYLFPGHINGNINILNNLSSSDSTIIFNGGMNLPNNNLTQSGGNLVLQGQPVIHAVAPLTLRRKLAFFNKDQEGDRERTGLELLKTLGDESLHTQAQRFEQPDWENHFFTLDKLNLTNTNLYLGRNSLLSADIIADNSPINIGAPKNLWIEHRTSDAIRPGQRAVFHSQLVSGESEATNDADQAYFFGNIKTSNSVVNIEYGHWILADSNTLTTPLKMKFGTVDFSLDSTKANTLTLNSLEAQNSKFSWNIWHGNTTNSKLVLNNTPTGTGNTLNLLFSNRNGSPSLPWANGILELITAPESTPDNYFTINKDQLNKYYNDAYNAYYPRVDAPGIAPVPAIDYTPVLDVITRDGKKIWQLDPSKSTVTINKSFHVDHSYMFPGTLTTAQNEFAIVNLIHPKELEWEPITFGAKKLVTRNSTFLLESSPQTGQSDKVVIGTTPGRGDNLGLLVNWHQLNTSPAKDMELVLAEAPKETPDTYFSIGTLGSILERSVGDYELSRRIEVQGDTKRWLLNPLNSSFTVDRAWTLDANYWFPGLLAIKSEDERKKRNGEPDARVEIHLTGAESRWQPHTINVGKLDASRVNFHFYSDVNADKDSEPLMQVFGKVTGTQNTLNLLFTDKDQLAKLPASPDNLVLFSAPEDTSENYFTVRNSTMDLGLYKPSIKSAIIDGKRQWKLDAKASAFDLQKDVTLTDNYRFSGNMTINGSLNVTLSTPSFLWQPHQLTLGTLNAVGVNFHLHALNTADAEGKIFSDNIAITDEAKGGGNNLRLTFIQPGGALADLPISPKNLLLASAPKNALDNYFRAGTSKTTLGDYQLALEMRTEGENKNWYLSPENSSFTLNEDVRLSGSYDFAGEFKASKRNITLSTAGAGWQPSQLTFGKLDGRENRFNLHIASQPDEKGTTKADRITVRDRNRFAFNPGNHTLHVQFVNADGALEFLPASPENLVLASAPSAEGDNYFTAKESQITQITRTIKPEKGDPQTTTLITGEDLTGIDLQEGETRTLLSKYLPGLTTRIENGIKQWLLAPQNAKFSLLQDFTLTQSYDFAGEFNVANGKSLELSQIGETITIVPNAVGLEADEDTENNTTAAPQSWTPNQLTLGKLNASEVNFKFKIASQTKDGVTQADKLVVKNQITGNNNKLQLQFINDDHSLADLPASPEAIVLASTPAEVDDNYFTVESISMKFGEYQPGLITQAEPTNTRARSTIGAGNVKNWLLSSENSTFTLNQDLTLTHDYRFDGQFIVPEGKALNLSPSGKNWQPWHLTLGGLTASGNAINFHLSSLPQPSGQTLADKITITRNAAGTGRNLLNLNFISAEGGVTKLPGSPEDLILASAPQGTADDYFIAGTTTTAIGQYVPALTTQTENGVKSWHLSTAQSTFTVQNNWQLSQDYSFGGQLHLATGKTVTLSAPGANWQPHKLTLNQLQASGNQFNFTIGTSGEHDTLALTSKPQGSGAIIDVKQQGRLANNTSYELTLASAPKDTPTEYFNIRSPNINSSRNEQGKAPIMATEISGETKNWLLVAQAGDGRWQLQSDRQLETLTMVNNGISFSNPGANNWTPHTLTVGTLNSRGTTFEFSFDLQNNRQDQLIVTDSIRNFDNVLSVKYVGNPTTLRQGIEQPFFRAPLSSTAGYFPAPFVRKPGNINWDVGVAITDHADYRQWSLISSSKAAPWRINQDRQFNSLQFFSGGTVALSDPNTPNWQPHQLTVNTLLANNVTFNLTAQPHTNKADRINILTTASGRNNKLDVSFLLQPTTTAFTSNLVLASAPQRTPDAYFTVDVVEKGLSLYKPNVSMVTNGDKKEWHLIYSAAPLTALTPVPGSTPEPVPEPVNTQPEVPQPLPEATTSEPPADETLSRLASVPVDNSPPILDTPDAPTQTLPVTPAPPPPPTSQPSGNLGFFAREAQANAPLIRNIQTVLAVPNLSFVLETNQLNKRLGDVRQLAESDGLWIKGSGGRATYHQASLYHNTVQMGFDKKAGNHLFGVMGSYTRGHSQAANLGEKHTTGGFGLYYSWIEDEGFFVDVIGKYLRNHHTFRFPDTVMGTQFPRSTTLMGSVQAGYHARLMENRFFVEPSLEMLAGRTTGYTLAGEEVKIRVQNSTPIYSKVGLAAGINWQSGAQQGITLATGLYRLQNLRRNGDVEMMDSTQLAHRQIASKDNRYLANLSLNARISANWRIYAQLETSFGSELKDDYSGQLGARFQF